MLGDRLPQVRDAKHGWILIHPVAEVFDACFDHVVGAVAVGETLAEVDRIVFLGEPRHDFEYRCTVARKYAVTGAHANLSLYAGRFGSIPRRIDARSSV